MADTEKKISELDSAAQINTDDITVLSQGNSGTGFASVKATILAIANKIVSGINFSSALQTTDKTITGAINEVAQGGGGGGASELDDLDDVSISSPTNGQVLKYNSTSQEWENANESGGGSGGHTILDNDGTALAQEDDLQFAGTYSEDDSTNGKTVVNITREMTQADYDLLTADEKVGIIRITDDNFVCDGSEVKYSNGVSVKDKIDEVSSQIGTLKYISLGNLTASSEADAWGKAFDLLSDGSYIVQFGYAGAHIGVFHKYGNGQYGMAFGMAYYATSMYRMKVMSGTKTFLDQ